jgi:predicted RNA binding protein YcfA (HicA-like mRNA interferase family)
MTKQEKLLEQARSHPASLRFADFETLLAESGWTRKRQRSSHRLWYSPHGHRLPIQNEDGQAKPYQVRQFLTVYRSENP